MHDSLVEVVGTPAYMTMYPRVVIILNLKQTFPIDLLPRMAMKLKIFVSFEHIGTRLLQTPGDSVSPTLGPSTTATIRGTSPQILITR